MRSSLDVEKVKKSTILGQEARIAKLKIKAAEERVRVPEQATEPKISLDEQARTRNQLIQQRKDREFAYNSQNFANFKSGIHSGKPIPNFYSSVQQRKETEQDATEKNETTVEWYKVGKDPAKAAKNVSLRKYQMQCKYWANPDELYLNEVDEVAAR